MTKLVDIIEKVTNNSFKGIESANINPDHVSEWDSLSHLNLIMILEEEYGVDILPDEIIDMFKGYNYIIEILKNHGVDNI